MYYHYTTAAKVKSSKFQVILDSLLAKYINKTDMIILLNLEYTNINPAICFNVYLFRMSNTKKKILLINN